MRLFSWTQVQQDGKKGGDQPSVMQKESLKPGLVSCHMLEGWDQVFSLGANSSWALWTLLSSLVESNTEDSLVMKD